MDDMMMSSSNAHSSHEERGKQLLAGLFPQSVRERLAAVKRPPASEWDSAGIPVRERHRIVAPLGPRSLPYRGAYRRVWARYLAAAEAAGLLNAEIRSRLTGDDDENFRGAMAECLTAWFFAQRLNHEVRSRPEGTATKNVDFEITAPGGISVRAEVKSPYVPLTSDFWAGNDAGVIRRCLEDAGRQFKKTHANLLVVVPLLRNPVYLARSQLVEALIGQWAWSVPIIIEPSDDRHETETIFLQNGKLAKRWPTPTGGVTTDLTRVSAAMTIEEKLIDDNGDLRVDHAVSVVHNPFAARPIASIHFGHLPQLVLVAGRMTWTDGYSKPR
jgi:hypothetical protein